MRGVLQENLVQGNYKKRAETNLITSQVINSNPISNTFVGEQS